MKILTPTSPSPSPTQTTSPAYELREETFFKQLNEAMGAANQLEESKHKSGQDKILNMRSAFDQLQISMNHMNGAAYVRSYNSAGVQNLYKAQKSGVRSKLETNL